MTITITGTNDAAVITGDRDRRGDEAAGSPARRRRRATSLRPTSTMRRTPCRWLRRAATTNGYGTYAVTAAGVWTYTLDNSNAAVQALNATARR